MKKVIIIEILLIIVLSVLIACLVEFAEVLKIRILYNGSKEYITQSTLYVIFVSFAILCNIAIIVLIALKEFTIFKPLLDKLQARKEQRLQAKTERAEANKQAKIIELEKQLEELKKDEENHI